MATTCNSWLVSFVPFALAASLAACATTARPVDATPVAESAGVTLLVRNYNWLQVNVYVLRATARHRLGTVSSMGTEIFRIPRHLYAASGTVQLRADPVGSQDTFTTDAILIGSAQQIEWTVAEYLPASWLLLR